MTEEERKDYLKYIENYTINDLADIFNTQNFVIQDKDKFNEILLYYHFKQNEEIEQLQKENQKLKYNWNKLRETLKNEQLGRILYSDRTRFANIDEILDKMQELEKSDSNE